MNKVLVPFQILLLVLIIQTSAKVIDDVESIGRFDRKAWSYLTKFAAAPGTGSFKAKAKFHKSIHNPAGKIGLNILAYTEDEWNQIGDRDDCKKKESLAKHRYPFDVPSSGDWSVQVEGKLQQHKTTVWYFVLSDCKKQLSTFTMGNRIHWEVEALNSDGSHFSEDENGMITPLLLVMVVIVGFFWVNSMKFYKFYKQEEGIDYPTLITTVALFFEFLSVFCEVMHLWIYSIDGRGSAFFNFFNHILSISSQFLIACLLLLIAYGWSINFMEFQDMEVFIPLGVLLGIVHVIVVGVGKITDDEHYSYHDYENWAGIVILILRFILFAVWIFLLSESYKVSRGAEKNFFSRFGVFGAIYFLAFPILVVYSSFWVAPASRHKVVTTGTLFIQTFTLVILTVLFTTKKSQYSTVCLKGKALLPTNKYL